MVAGFAMTSTWVGWDPGPPARPKAKGFAMAFFMIALIILLRLSSAPSQYQVFKKNGVGPFGGCNPAAVSSALSLCNPPPGLGFHTKINIAIPRSKGSEQYSDDLSGMGCSPQREGPRASLTRERRHIRPWHFAIFLLVSVSPSPGAMVQGETWATSSARDAPPSAKQPEQPISTLPHP